MVTRRAPRLAAVLATLALALALALLQGLPAAARVTITRDIYVQPAAEFQTSLGYPDIVTIENDLIKVVSLPNRGRVLLDIVAKGAGARGDEAVSLLFSRTSSILPLEVGGRGYFLEFGGHYTDVPWNPRDNQPCELSYQTLGAGEDGGRVTFRSDDPTTGLRMEAVLGVDAGAAAVDVSIRLYNPSGREILLPEFRDTTVFSALRAPYAVGGGGPAAPAAQPVEADIELAVAGRRFRWKDYGGRFSATVGVGELADPAVTAVDSAGEGRDTLGLTRSWPAGQYDAVIVTTWGPAFDDEMGAVPAFIVTAVKRTVTIGPGGSAAFSSRFTVERSAASR